MMKKALVFIQVSVFILSCTQMAKPDHPSGNEIALEWEFIGNQATGRQYSAAFTLENNSAHTLGNQGWELFYSQMGGGIIQESVTGNVTIAHVNGDLFRISPNEDFILEPGQSVEIGYNSRGRMVNYYFSPAGPYMVYADAGGKVAALAIEDYTIKPFPPLEEIFMTGRAVPVPDASWVYGLNIQQALEDPAHIGQVIPTPSNVEYTGNAVILGERLMIHSDEGLDREAAYLAEMLEKTMGKAPMVMQSTARGSNIIRLISGDEHEGLIRESYHLSADPDNGVVIAGGGSAGLFYGIQSLLAMLPVEAWATPQSSLSIRSVNVTDKPAFAYRGMHLDIARNYLEPEAIKKLIQVMAFYKMNKLHLHLSDDEGWRLEIPSLPELTEIGGHRGHTVDQRDHLSPAYGSGPDPSPEAGHGSGYLTRETFIEILKFADDHHIEVIPEINFPGHARAAIYSMETRYDRLMEKGKEEEALKYRLIDPDDASRYNSAQDFNDNVVCVCLEAPYLFYETVLDEVMGMYEEAGLTLKVLHTGGDEVPRGSWTDSPVCKSFLESHPEIGGAENLQAYFEGRLLEIIDKKGLQMAGWEEISLKRGEGGRWIPNPDFAGKNMLPFVWDNQNDNADLGYRLANAGYPVVLCNVTNFYFDLAYSHHPQEHGHSWGGYINTKRAFQFIPYDFFKSTLADRYWNPIDPAEEFEGLERLKPEAYKNIIGIQGELWSEFIKGGEMLEFFYLPKMLGLAERAWVGQTGWGSVENTEARRRAMNADWNSFANMIGQREMPRLDHLFGGYNYRLPPPGAVILDGKLHANIDFPGLEIRYTTDGSEPVSDSPLYTGPVEVSGKVLLRSFDTRDRGSRVSGVESD